VCVCARVQWRRRRGEVVLSRNTCKPMGATEKALAKSIATIAMAQIAITEDLRHRRIAGIPKHMRDSCVRDTRTRESSTSYLLLRPTPLFTDPKKSQARLSHARNRTPANKHSCLAIYIRNLYANPKHKHLIVGLEHLIVGLWRSRCFCFSLPQTKKTILVWKMMSQHFCRFDSQIFKDPCSLRATQR